MKDQQWSNILTVLRGERVAPLPIGFIIDSPWLPGWCGMAIADYLSSENLWFEANRKVIETFPEGLFLPEFGPSSACAPSRRLSGHACGNLQPS
jgi:hypothetical protein